MRLLSDLAAGVVKYECRRIKVQLHFRLFRLRGRIQRKENAKIKSTRSLLRRMDSNDYRKKPQVDEKKMKNLG